MIIHSWNHSVWNSDMVFFLFYFCTNRNASEKMWLKCNLCEEKTFKNKTFIYNSHEKIRDEQIPQQLFTHLTFYGRFYAHQMWHIFILKDSLYKFPQQPRGHHYFLTPFAILSLISETIFIRSVWHFLLIEVSEL